MLWSLSTLFFFSFVQNSRIYMFSHPKSCAQLLFVCTQFMEGCSQPNSPLLPIPVMPAPYPDTYRCMSVDEKYKRTICFCKKQSWFQNVWGLHEQIWECSFAKKSLVKYCCCELKVTNAQGREWLISGKKRVCSSGFSAPTAVAENEESFQPPFLVFSEMSWLM